MTVHQPGRFPRDTTNLALPRNPGGSFTPVLDQLSHEELCHLEDVIQRYHAHASSADQCGSMVAQRIRVPAGFVWPVVRRFDNPQAYKRFIKRCSMRGDGRVGSTREVELVSGLPAESSTERLEILDEERHILSFKIVGGQHRLRNYNSVTTLHESEIDGKLSTIVIESYVVDVPDGNTVEDTKAFVDTIVKCNLASLARVSERQASCSMRRSL